MTTDIRFASYAPTIKLVGKQGATADLYAADALTIIPQIPDATFDLIISSPPYSMGKSYEASDSLDEFIRVHTMLMPQLSRIVKPLGSICWQVGHHVSNNSITPLDAIVFNIAREHTDLVMRNRIIWTFGHGFHGQRRFSGRHETILWFTKEDNYTFNLDSVRIPQKYPGKRAYKGPRKGEWSGNPLGKNPGDVWDIPNVKARHPEKTDHPCQFPVALVSRLIRALSSPNDMIFDPFMGSGTAGVAALIDKRNFTGIDLHPRYVTLAAERMRALDDGPPVVRPDTPPQSPKLGAGVSMRPPHFQVAST
jgi:adenine-specific DNA-methyltransferase